MALTHPGRANQKRVALLADKMTGGQFVDARAIDGGVESKVEMIQERISRKSAAFWRRTMVRCSRTLSSS
jgi:hypothetical protein